MALFDELRDLLDSFLNRDHCIMVTPIRLPPEYDRIDEDGTTAALVVRSMPIDVFDLIGNQKISGWLGMVRLCTPSEDTDEVMIDIKRRMDLLGLHVIDLEVSW